jgi:hypothetical protein
MHAKSQQYIILAAFLTAVFLLRFWFVIRLCFRLSQVGIMSTLLLYR